MANIALKKTIIENNWKRAEEFTNGDYINYNGKQGFAHSSWPAYLTLDLQDVFDIETIRFLLWNKDTRIFKYRLLTSEDMTNWNVHFDTAESGYSGWQEFSFQDKIKARYIRIHCLWNSINAGFHIVQMQVYDDNTENINIIPTNKRLILSQPSNSINEIKDGLPMTQKMNNLTNSLERILSENMIINPAPFQEIITNFRLQAYDIESLEKSIDSIRREIISPVQKELQEGKKLGKFSVWGFYIGFAGIIVSIIAILNGIFKWI